MRVFCRVGSPLRRSSIRCFAESVGQETPKKVSSSAGKSFFATKKGLMLVTVFGTGIGVLSYWGFSFYQKMEGMFAENKAMQLFEQQGADPFMTYYSYIHAQLAHRVLECDPIVQHMGALRFAPETIKMSQVSQTQQLVLMFNVYGTRRAGIVYVLLQKGVNQNGMPTLEPLEFQVDSWDGHTWEVPLPREHWKIDMSDAYEHLLLRKGKKD